MHRFLGFLVLATSAQAFAGPAKDCNALGGDARARADALLARDALKVLDQRAPDALPVAVAAHKEAAQPLRAASQHADDLGAGLGDGVPTPAPACRWCSPRSCSPGRRAPCCSG